MNDLDKTRIGDSYAPAIHCSTCGSDAFEWKIDLICSTCAKPWQQRAAKFLLANVSGNEEAFWAVVKEAQAKEAAGLTP